LKDGSGLFAGEHDGQPGGPLRSHDVVEPGQVLFEDVAIEKEMALRAWFWVDAATFLSTTRALKNCVTSAPPISAGWRLRWKKNRRIHAT